MEMCEQEAYRTPSRKLMDVLAHYTARQMKISPCTTSTWRQAFEVQTGGGTTPHVRQTPYQRELQNCALCNMSHPEVRHCTKLQSCFYEWRETHMSTFRTSAKHERPPACETKSRGDTCNGGKLMELERKEAGRAGGGEETRARQRKQRKPGVRARLALLRHTAYIHY